MFCQFDFSLAMNAATPQLLCSTLYNMYLFKNALTSFMILLTFRQKNGTMKIKFVLFTKTVRGKSHTAQVFSFSGSADSQKIIEAYIR